MEKWMRILFSLVLIISCKANSKSAEKSWQKSLAADRESFVALDVRTTEEVSNHPAIGAINIPIDQLESRIDQLDKSKAILVFCEAGFRASRAKKLLQKSGFQNVENVGSWRKWNAAQKN